MRKSALLILSGLFFLLSSSSVHAIYDPANPTGSSKINSEIICINGVACQNSGGACSSYNTDPLVRVHRFDVLFQRSVSNANIIIGECIQTPAGQLCLPPPIKAGGTTIRNFLAEGSATPASKSSIKNNLDDYARGFQAMCQAAYPSTDWDTAGCNDLAAIQAELEKNPVVKYLQNTDVDHNFLGIYKKSGESGLDPILGNLTSVRRNDRFEWADENKKGLNRFFRAIAFYSPVSGTTGSTGSNSVATLGFQGGDDESCPVVRVDGGDPYGQVFDKTSLEPVEGVKVALYMEMPSQLVPGTKVYEFVDTNKAEWRERYGITNALFKNPYMTTELGDFSFIVAKNNKYKLLVTNPSVSDAALPKDLTADSDLSLFSAANYVMDPNGAAFGKQVIVKSGTSEESLYPSKVAVSELNDRQVYQVTTNGTTVNLPVINFLTVDQQRDIASVGVAPKAAKVLTSRGYRDSLQNLVLTGQINKPFGSVDAVKTGTAEVLGTSTADVKGLFTVVVSATKLKTGDKVDLIPKAAPLVQVSKVSQIPMYITRSIETLIKSVFGLVETKVQAQEFTPQTTFTYNPSYLEGYAYDASGALMKNAKVAIYDSNVAAFPSFVTTTDEKGFFSITSENVPSSDYSIRYVSNAGGTPVSVDPGMFVKQNKTYLEENNVDLAKPKYSEEVQAEVTKYPPVVISGVAVAEGPTQSGMAESGLTGSPMQPVTSVTPAPTTSPLSTTLLMYVAILLFLIVGAGLLIVYYMKHKQEPHLYEQQ